MKKESLQDIENKQGEVIFRRKLATQQSDDTKIYFEESHTKEEILRVMEERIIQSRLDFKALSEADIQFTPYFEFGAERCQRALLLENEFNASGFALDISLDMLKYASVVADEFGFQKTPIRIACDANNLPFQNETISFAFCYQTLHHFPDPRPICEEVARTLMGDSTFFFDDEPIRGSIRKQIGFYHRRGHKLNLFERILEKLRLLAVVSKADELETEHNILEQEFDLLTWRRALLGFDPQEIVVNRKLQIKLRSLEPSLRASIAQLVGGNIRALAKLRKPFSSSQRSEDLLSLLGCPNCDSKPKLDRLPSSGLRCSQCENVYPEVDGVLLMFEKTLGKLLYPEYLNDT